MGRSSFEQMTGAQVTIDYEHHMIHRGLGFTAHYESEAPVPTAVGEETAVGFVTPPEATALIHMLVDVRADDESLFEIREAPTIVLDQGAQFTVLNRYRGSPNVSTLVPATMTAPVPGDIYTYTALQAAAGNLALGTGTSLHRETLAIAAGPPFASVLNTVARGQREWICLPDTAYVVILTNLTINDTIHEIVLNWYENNESDNYVIRG